MIVVDEGESLFLVTQNDHAHLAGEVLALWRTDGLPDHPAREDLLFAARNHDNGWRETDAAPPIDADSGRPYDFLRLPAPWRAEVWERGCRRFAEERPLAALWICRHALELLEGAEPDLLEARERIRELADELAADLEISAGEVEHGYRFLDRVDLLSLTACARWRAPLKRPGLRACFDGGTLRLAPFPLAGATTFRLSARRIPARRYAGTVDLVGELAAARWTEVEVRLAPLDPSLPSAPGCAAAT